MIDYELISKKAEEAGGPQVLAESLVLFGRLTMRPFIALAALSGGIVSILGVELFGLWKRHKMQSYAECQKVKDEFIEGINEYNADKELKALAVKELFNPSKIIDCENKEEQNAEEESSPSSIRLFRFVSR